jgi:RNA polymerase sigma-B factor
MNRVASATPSARVDHQRHTARAEEDRALFERLADKGEAIDREMLVERFLPLARSLAARYVSHGEPFDDVFQVACLGLLKAIDRFDVTRGRAFSSYAVPTIAGEIKRYYRDRTWSVHVPRDLQDLALRVEQERRVLETRMARSPTVAELAAHLDASDEDVVEALHAHGARRSESLDAPVGADGDPDTTVGESFGAGDRGYQLAESRADLARLARVLSERDRAIVRMRFVEDLNQQQIGDRVGLSQMQISRILRRSIERLREQARRQDDSTARDAVRVRD